jgi:hypothetical protein
MVKSVSDQEFDGGGSTAAEAREPSDRKPAASTALYRSGNTTRSREVASRTYIPKPELAGHDTQ